MLLKKNSDFGGEKKNILTLVLSEKKILNETKNHNPPPLQVKWSVPNLFRPFGFIVLATLNY